MHLLRVRAVVVDAVNGNPLAEVGLEAVYAHIEQCFQPVLIPFTCLRVGEVHQRHTRLPHIPLPYVAVWPFYEITFFCTLGKKNRFLTDVGIDPNTDVQAFCLDSGQHACGIGEHLFIPHEIGPVEALHPEAVEMEGAQRNAAVQHTVDKTHHRLFIIVGGEGGGQPQAEGPWGREGRFTGKIRISHEHVLHGGAVKEEVIQTAAFYTEGCFRHVLGAKLHGHTFRMVDKYAISLIGKEEGDILVCLLCAGAAVLVVDFHALSVFDKRGEAFAGAVEQLAHADSQLLPHIGVFQIPVNFVEIALIGGFHQCKVASAAFGQHAVPAFVGHGPGVFRDDKRQGAAGDHDRIFCVFYMQFLRCIQVQIEGRRAHQPAHMVIGLHTQNVRHGGGDADVEIDAAQRIPAMCDRMGGCA